MGRSRKIAIVAGGYVAAFAAAGLAGWLYDVRVSKLPYDTSGGMYAAGEALQSLAAFLLVALVPTLAWLWFLRPHRRVWGAIATGALVFAVAGLAAVLTPAFVRPDRQSIPFLVVELVSLTQLLGVPLWVLAFSVFAVMAPTREARRTLLASVAVELVAGVCVCLHWLLPRPPF